MCPRNRAPSCPLHSVGVGRRGHSEQGGRLQRNYRTVIFSPLTCPTLHLPLTELPSPFCVSIPSLVCVLPLSGSLSSPLSESLSLSRFLSPSVCAAHVCAFSLWVSSLWVLAFSPVSSSSPPVPSFSGSPPCGSLSPLSSCISVLGSLVHLFLPNSPAHSLARRSPEGKGAQGGSACSHGPRARPGDGEPGGCLSWGSAGRRVPAGAPGGRAWPGSVGAAAVGADATVRRRGVRGPGRLLAGARAPAQPAAPRRPFTDALPRAHARTLPGAGFLRLSFPSFLPGARPHPGCPRGRGRPPRRCDGGGGAGPWRGGAWASGAGLCCTWAWYRGAGDRGAGVVRPNSGSTQ